VISPKPLASAMMVPTRQVTVPTTAGRSVRFVQGIATINDTNDLPYLFARPDCRVMVTEYAMSWMGEVLEKTPQIKADVHWPTDWLVTHRHQDDFLIVPPGTEVEMVDVPPADVLDDALKGRKKPWPKPPSN